MITEYLMLKDPSLVEMPEPTDANYTCFNTGGVETAVGEFLYGFVRMTKPEYILETGTHMGISSSYMGKALVDNKKGTLTTIEIEKEHINTSKARWDRIGISDYVFVDKENSTEYDVEYDCDLMFLDSEPNLRFRELRRFFPRLKPGGFAFIHDAPRGLCQGNVNTDHPEFKSWPFGDINQEVKTWVLDHELVPFHFATPRGLVGFYKKHPDDFNFWKEIIPNAES
jgi:predicted O-methyltransferase YrrM